MKAVAVMVLLTSVSLVASAAAPEHVQFTGTVQQDLASPVIIDLHLPSRQDATVRLSDGSTLELATPGSRSSADVVRIRLLDPTGAVMHTATVPDAGTISASFAYRVCAGEVTYISPAPAVMPDCGA